jgi:hypothetical protein
MGNIEDMMAECLFYLENSLWEQRRNYVEYMWNGAAAWGKVPAYPAAEYAIV